MIVNRASGNPAASPTGLNEKSRRVDASMSMLLTRQQCALPGAPVTKKAGFPRPEALCQVS